jgi:hypothetical protein
MLLEQTPCPPFNVTKKYNKKNGKDIEILTKCFRGRGMGCRKVRNFELLLMRGDVLQYIVYRKYRVLSYC